MQRVIPYIAIAVISIIIITIVIVTILYMKVNMSYIFIMNITILVKQSYHDTYYLL